METPRPQEFYRHFKGNLYQIITVAKHSETGEAMVIYQALYGDYQVYARPLDSFVSPVDRDKYPDVAQKMRFEKVSMENLSVGAESSMKAPASNPAPIPASTTTSTSTPVCPSSAQTNTINGVDPAIMEFLDAETYEAKLNVLASVRFRITDEMLTTMAIACDMDLADAPVEERFEALKAGLLKKEKYECNRLRG